MENVELVSITPNAMELLKQVAAVCYQVPPSEREGAIAMDKTKAADKAKRIAENLSGYAADFYGLERSIRSGKSDASDMAYELEALIDELEALSDELEWALKDIRER